MFFTLTLVIQLNCWNLQVHLKTRSNWHHWTVYLNVGLPNVEYVLFVLVVFICLILNTSIVYTCRRYGVRVIICNRIYKRTTSHCNILVCDFSRTPVVMARHRCSCVHFSRNLHLREKLEINVYVIVANKRLQPITTTWYKIISIDIYMLAVHFYNKIRKYTTAWISIINFVVEMSALLSNNPTLHTATLQTIDWDSTLSVRSICLYKALCVVGINLLISSPNISIGRYTEYFVICFSNVTSQTISFAHYQIHWLAERQIRKYMFILRKK